MLNPHAVLGVPTNASPADIKAAYRRLASRLHPDRNPDQKEAEEQLKDVNRAYEALCEREQQWAPRASKSNDFFSFIDRVTGFFKPPTEVVVPLTFEEALRGVTKQADLDRQVPCPSCAGKDARTKGQCQACRGEGRTSVKDRVLFEFEPGVGEGEGVESASALGYPMVGIPQVAAHPLWERDGMDLTAVVPLSIDDLWAGNRVRVLTPYARLEYALPPGFCLASPVRFVGQGVAMRSGCRGDLWVTFAVELPDQAGLSRRKQERASLEALWSPVGLPS